MRFFKQLGLSALATCGALCFLLTFDGCKSYTCGGKFKVECYNKEKKWIGFFCEDEQPPCQCFEADGTTDQLGKFSQACDPNISTDGVVVPIPGTITVVDEPYKFDCPSVFNTSICPEYAVNYMDVTTAGVSDYRPQDYDYRPIYFRFEIDNFNISKYDYVFRIKNSSGSLITYIQISNGQIPEDLIRYIDPLCTGICDVEGTVKLEARNIRQAGTYTTELEQVDNSIPLQPVRTLLSSTTFDVKFTQGSSQSRIFNFVIYKHGLADLSTYSVAGEYLSGDLLKNVFGEGQSNLRFNSETKTITTPYVDDGGNAMLNSNHLRRSNIAGDLKTAIGHWVEDVYSNLPISSVTYKGFGLDVTALRRYDFSTSRATKDEGANNEIDDATGFVGITAQRSPNSAGGYYNGTLVIRWAVVDELDIYQRASDADAYSLTVFLHELGHMWSPAGTPDIFFGDGCDEHQALGNGRNFHYCLWHCPAPGTGWDYVRQRLEEPVFCEGHQQVFLNQLEVTF
jgi:hypothetical protein